MVITVEWFEKYVKYYARKKDSYILKPIPRWLRMQAGKLIGTEVSGLKISADGLFSKHGQSI